MSNALATLLKKSTLDDHDALLKASNQALSASSNDSQAQQVKAIALVKLDRHEEALQHFEKYKDIQQSLPEAFAYVLYKNDKFTEAVAALSDTKDSRGAEHIRLQAAYRAEDWDTAEKAHESLLAEDVSEESAELRINKLAVDAEGLWTSNLKSTAVPRAKTDDLATFETAYNSACISVSKGQLEEADVLLKRSINLCEHLDSYSDEDKAVELVPLLAQRVYVLQKLQKADEASKIAQELEATLQGTKVDAKVRRLAETNAQTASEKMSNPFMAHKLFSQSSSISGQYFFGYETSALMSNAKSIHLQSFKYDGLINAAKKQAAKASLPSTSPEVLLVSMFDAAARARGEISKAAIRKVLPELEKRPNDVGLAITLVQLYILTGNTTAAIDLLQSFFDRLENSSQSKDQDIRYAPGLVGLMVSLYKSQGRRSQLKQELAKSATYWRSKSKAPTSLLRAAGVVLLEADNAEDVKSAREIFDKVYSQAPDDKATIAGYVASHASDSSAEVEQLAEKLRPVDELTAAVDVDALEQAGIPQSTNALAIAQAGQGKKRAANDDESSKPKRVRKSRLPKDYDPNKKPDPERWLPLRDRSTYKPKKKKGKKTDRTQGGGNVNEALDISNKPASSDIVTENAGPGKKKNKKGKK